MDDGERLLLFDPIAPSEIESLAAERETAVVLTCLRARHAGPGRAPGRAGAIFDADGPLDLAAALDLMRRHRLAPAVQRAVSGTGGPSARAALRRLLEPPTAARLAQLSR
jgi:hypothetical protein